MDPRLLAISPLEFALRGFHIFPCKGKEPLVKWSQESTTDHDTIARWADQFPGCWWGVDCRKSGIVVLDDDRGKNKSAVDSLWALTMEYGDIPQTFVVKTPTGGYHHYFYGHGRNSASTKLGPGLDSRGDGGYVMAPCSPGYLIDLDVEIVDAPDWFIRLIGTPIEREQQPVPENVTLDTDLAIERATQYLKAASPAIEGQGGDAQTYKVSCAVRDMGISKERCLDLMLEHWDERCIPPWGPALAAKVENAYRYAVSQIAANSPEHIFTPFVDNDPKPQEHRKSMFIDATELLKRDIVVNYLVQGIVETPGTGLMFGESTVGKSFLAIDMALGVATGNAWVGHLAAKGPVFYLAGEGQAGIPRRLQAAVKHHNLTLEDKMLHVSRSRIELDASSAKTMVKEISSMALENGNPALIIIDTLARHIPGDADENSAKDIGAFINAVDYLKNAFRCVVLVIHHSGKGSKDQSRGSSALKAAMDFEIKVKPGVVQYTKQKDGELPAPFGYALVDVQIKDDVKSAAVVSSSIDPSADLSGLSARAVLGLQTLKMEVSANEGRGVPADVWRKAFLKQVEQAEGTALNRSTASQAFKRVTESLVSVKLVELVEGLYWLVEGDDDD